MKKLQGFSIAATISTLLIIALTSIVVFLVIDGNNKSTDYNNYDLNSVIAPNEHNGNIEEHVKGNPNAPVIIVEYADFQCEYCAMMNTRINKIVEESDGKLAVVYRNFLLSYHQNGTAAASAAEAAGLQGYWKAYADKLFSEQSSWAYASPSERTTLFNQYFLEVTDNKGDLDKFNEDISSPAVSQKISFDIGIAKHIKVGGTPAFYIDGQFIDFGNKNGGAVTVNGNEVKWDKTMSGDDFNKLIKDIVEAKLK